MKVSVLLLVCAALFSLDSYSQTDTAERMSRNRYDSRNDTTSYQVGDSTYGTRPGAYAYPGQSRQYEDSSTHRSGFIMENGSMMVTRNGISTMLNKDTTLSNGTKIMRNGTIIMQNGTQRTLKEGEYVNMSGKIMPMNRGDKSGKNMNRNRDNMRDSLNKNNMGGNRDMDRERNKVRTNKDSTNRKKDMYLVPDSAKHHYEKK